MSNCFLCKWPAGGAERVSSDVGRGAQGQAQGRVQTHGGEFCLVKTDSVHLLRVYFFAFPNWGEKKVACRVAPTTRHIFLRVCREATTSFSNIEEFYLTALPDCKLACYQFIIFLMIYRYSTVSLIHQLD